MNTRDFDFFRAYLESFLTTYDPSEIADAEYAESIAQSEYDEDYVEGRIQ